VLLAQTITLALNTRFDGDLGEGVTLCRYITTSGADAGLDGCLGSEDDVENLGSLLTVEIPAEVLSYLGAGATVADLLELANCVLAGDDLPVTYEQVAGACGAINEGFDECRFLASCTTEPPIALNPEPEVHSGERDGFGSSEQDASFGAGVPVRFGLFQALPNPTRSSSSIRFGLPETSQVRLVLYNIRGQEVGVLVNDVMDKGYKTLTVDLGGRGLSSGIYLYRLEASGLESGSRFVETQKLLLVQ
jgi:hypothetical protein